MGVHCDICTWMICCLGHFVKVKHWRFGAQRVCCSTHVSSCSLICMLTLRTFQSYSNHLHVCWCMLLMTLMNVSFGRCLSHQKQKGWWYSITGLSAPSTGSFSADTRDTRPRVTVKFDFQTNYCQNALASEQVLLNIVPFGRVCVHSSFICFGDESSDYLIMPNGGQVSDISWSTCRARKPYVVWVKKLHITLKYSYQTIANWPSLCMIRVIKIYMYVR